MPSSPDGLSFHLLGRLEAYSDGVEVDLGPRKQRAVLALLLLNANRVVSTERLIDDLWGDFPPSTARAALQVYVAGLRKALGTDGATLRTRAPGYVLEVEEGALDLDRFAQLCAEAHESPDPERRAALLHEALELWRDEPLPELRAEPFSSAAVAQLEQLRLRALEERIDADLALGRDATLVTELEALVAEHPYREGLRAQLMLTLYRSGRQAGALDVYQAGRRALQDDLGLEPGKELRDLEAAILRQDEALSVARSVPAEPEPEQPPSAGRLSRRAVIAACIAGFAAVALGTGLAVLRSGSGSAAQVKPGAVGVVDPVTRRVVADVPLGFSSPLIAAGEGSVWVVDPKGSTLTRIDPETNAVVTPQRGIPANGIPVGLAVGEGSVWIALNEGRVLSVLEVGPELGDLAATDPARTRVVGAFSLVVRVRRARRGCRRRLGTGAGAGAADQNRSGHGQAQAARRRPRCLVVDRSRRRRRLARRPRGREEARLAHGPGAWKRVGGSGARIDGLLDRGRPRGRVVRRRIERAAVEHRSTERVDCGLRTDRGKPERGSRRRGRGRLGRERCRSLALTPGTVDERRRDTRDRRDRARARRRLRPDLD